MYVDHSGHSSTATAVVFSIFIGAAVGAVSSILGDLLFNDGQIDGKNLFINTVLGGAAGAISGSGVSKEIHTILHSLDILERTMLNATTNAIGRQASAVFSAAAPLIVSGIKYTIGNSLATILSKLFTAP